MPQPLQRDRFTWLVYLLLAFFTYFTDILGPELPFLKDELHLNYTVSSLHFAALAAGILLVGLAGRRLVGRLSTQTALWNGAYGMSLGTLLITLGRTPWLTVPAAFLTGFGGGLLLAVGPAALSERHGENAASALAEMGTMTVFMGAAAPLLVSWSAAGLGSWRWVGFFALMPLGVQLVLGRPSEQPAEISAREAAQRGTVRSEPLPLLYWLYWSAIFLSESVEYCLIFWSPAYLEANLGLTKSSAALGASLFLVAMIAGRFSGSRLVRSVHPRRLVYLSLALTLVGFLIFWTAATVWFGLVGLFLSGLGVASLYPLCLSLALGAAQGNTLQGGARAALSTGFSILALPLVLGRLADLTGLRPAFGLVVALVAGAFLVVWAAGTQP